MPIIKSAKKRVRVSNKAAARNAKTKRSLRESLKAFSKALSGGDAKKISASQSKATSDISKAAKKNIMHKNKAARKQSNLAKAAKAAATATPKKKTAAKKPATKKAVAKKTTKK